MTDIEIGYESHAFIPYFLFFGHRSPNAIHADGGRNPRRRRTQSTQIAFAVR
ncbi:hypothetical protein [Leyella stercorea]|uniref:hypothetical protein n=1 Tax=Leyella stercorea TaxID=363265 RepID=UPI00242F05CD|nr:hypothetical protein [Leyella stercorea]